MPRNYSISTIAARSLSQLPTPSANVYAALVVDERRLYKFLDNLFMGYGCIIHKNRGLCRRLDKIGILGNIQTLVYYMLGRATTP